MKWNLTIILMGAMLVMASCTEKEVASPEVGTLEFQVDTRAEGTAGTQKVRLYVVDRRPELDVFTNPLCLYCPPEWQMDLDSPDASGKTAYILDHLLAQWYKFAFVCVPSEVKYAGAESLDFTRQWLDYYAVL